MRLSIRSTRPIDNPNGPDRFIASAKYLPLFAVGVAPGVGHDYRGDHCDFTLPIRLYGSSGRIQTLLLALAGFSLLIAWWLMSVNRPNRSFRVGVALLASFLIVLSMAGYIVFTKVPVSAIRSSRLLSALFFDVPGWWRYWNAFGDVALIGSFFAFRRTRIALVSSATIICTLWGATQHIWR